MIYLNLTVFLFFGCNYPLDWLWCDDLKVCLCHFFSSSDLESMSSAVQWEEALSKVAAVALASALWPREATTFNKAGKRVICARFAKANLVVTEDVKSWIEKEPLEK